MNEALQKSELLLDLFEHDGWTLFVDEFEDLSKRLKENCFLECNTNDEYQQRRGSLAVLSRIISYEDTVKRIHEEMEAGDDSEDL